MAIWLALFSSRMSPSVKDRERSEGEELTPSLTATLYEEEPCGLVHVIWLSPIPVGCLREEWSYIINIHHTNNKRGRVGHHWQSPVLYRHSQLNKRQYQLAYMGYTLNLTYIIHQSRQRLSIQWVVDCNLTSIEKIADLEWVGAIIDCLQYVQ